MGDKAAPKAMSVAFRTALLQALALPTDEPDPDSQSFEREEAKAPKAKPATRTMSRTPKADPLPVEDGVAMSGPQQAKMMLLFHKAGITQSDTRHQYIENVVGRPIVKSTEITKADASKVIDALEQDVREMSPEDADGP
jgi:hypothetical protein